MTRAEAAKLTYEELEALGFDDCGLPLNECPGLPQPGPLSSSWRDRPTFALVSGGMPGSAYAQPKAVATKAMRIRGSDGLTVRQRQILEALVATHGDRAAAARLIGLSSGGLYSSLAHMKRTGIPVPL